MTNLLKRILSVVLILSLITGIVPAPVFGADGRTQFSDWPNNWSSEALQAALDNGLMIGNNGKIRPNDFITRAELATIVNRAFGATETASLTGFSDIPAKAWYFGDMAKAVQMGTFAGSGNGLMRPDDPITREEAFAVINRAFELEAADQAALDKFSDKIAISPWAVPEVAAMAAAGYVNGDGINLKPKDKISRAEFAQVMHNIVKIYIRQSATVTEMNKGNVLISAAEVILKNLTIDGDLIIGNGVGTGTITLENVTVTGRILNKSGANIVYTNNTPAAGGSGGGGGGSGDNITVSFETFGDPLIPSATIKRGAKLSNVPLPSRPDDVFTGWYTDRNLSEPFNSDAPLNANVTLYAHWQEKDNNYKEYTEPEKFYNDCDPAYTFSILSAAPLTLANLSNYLLIESMGEIPPFTVTKSGGKYTIAPQEPYYEDGCIYVISLINDDICFGGEDAAVRTLTIGIHKEESWVVEYKNEVIDLLWDDVISHDADEETGIGFVTVPSGRYDNIKVAFESNIGNFEVKTIIRLRNGGNSNTNTEYRNVTGYTEAGGVLRLATEDSQLEDVFSDLDIYQTGLDIDLDDYFAGLDLEAIAAQAANSPGSQQMATVLNTAIGESPTIAALLADTKDEADPTLISAPDDRRGLQQPSKEAEKNLLKGYFNDVLKQQNIIAKTGKTDNINFGNRPGYYIATEFTYKGTIKNKVEVEAKFTVTEYMSLYSDVYVRYGFNLFYPSTWKDLQCQYLGNVYSQTDIKLNVTAKSVNKDPAYIYDIDITKEITKLINGGEGSGDDAAVLLKKVLGDRGDYIDLLDLPLMNVTVDLIPELPVVSIEFSLNFVVKANFAAGVNADISYLGARAFGFYYNLKNGEKKQLNGALWGDNQYYLDLWVAGYFGVKAGLKGEISFSLIGLKKIVDAGLSLELGVYLDIWALTHLEHWKVLGSGSGTSLQGGLYFEVGIYLEMAVFVRSKTFKAKAEWKFLDLKFPLYSMGERYVLTKFSNNDAHIIVRNEGFPLASLIDAEYLDLKTGQTVSGSQYGSPNKFYLNYNSPYFKSENGMVKVASENFGLPYFYFPLIQVGTKTVSTTATLYYRGSSINFGLPGYVYRSPDNDFATEYKKNILISWADDSLTDLSSLGQTYKATYYLDRGKGKELLDQREVFYGYMPGPPALPLNLTTWKDCIAILYDADVLGVDNDFGLAIEQDTEYTIKAVQLQRITAFITHRSGGSGPGWYFDVYAVDVGKTPALPPEYEAPFDIYTGLNDWDVMRGCPEYRTVGLHAIQTAASRYTLNADRNEYSYRPDTIFVSGYDTTAPLYSFYGGEGKDGSDICLRHSWSMPPDSFAPANGVMAGSFGWSRFYDYLYLANYRLEQHYYSFDAGAYQFVSGENTHLESYERGSYASLLDAGSKLELPEDDDYKVILTGWQGSDGKLYSPGASLLVTGAMSFTAVTRRSKKACTVTIKAGNGAFADGTTDDKVYRGMGGEMTDIGDLGTPLAAAPLHKFTRWSSNIPYLFSDDITITAEYTPLGNYAVYFSANGGRFADGATALLRSYGTGTTVDTVLEALPIPAKNSDTYNNYYFDYWDPFEFTVTENMMIIKAIYTEIPKVQAKVPLITGQPSGAAVAALAGATYTLTVAADSPDGGTLSYQWYSTTAGFAGDGALIPGATNASYNAPIDTEGTYHYYAVVTNTIADNGDGGVKTAAITSSLVYLYVTTAPVIKAQTPLITGQPEGATVTVAMTHDLAVTASVTDGGTLTYQWYSSTDNFNVSNTAIPGATGATYAAAIDTPGTLFYRVVVTNTIADNGDGGVKTMAVTSNTVYLEVIAAGNAQTPTIVTQPVGATVAAGSTRNLSVAANVTDGGILSFQWYKNPSNSSVGGTPVGTNSESYPVPTDTAGTSYYYVVVTNTNTGASGLKTATETSNIVKVTVFEAGLTGIMISDNGLDFEDIAESTIGGFTYGVVDDYNGEIQTLKITGNGLTLSGSGSDVRLVIGENVNDITFADLSLSLSDEYLYQLIYSEGSDSLTITIAADCSFGSESSFSALTFHRDLRFRGDGEGASLTVIAKNADAIWCRSDAGFANLNLTVTASGGIEDDWGQGIQIRYFQAIIAGVVDGGVLSFADMVACELACQGGLAVLANGGIIFTAGGEALDLSAYGVWVALNNDELYFIDYSTFVGPGGEPLARITIK